MEGLASSTVRIGVGRVPRTRRAIDDIRASR